MRCPEVGGDQLRARLRIGGDGRCSLTAAPILRYMGDYPSRQAWTSLELTDQIFSSALQEAVLQDEVYCQILKQLTHNTKRSVGSGEGWKAQRAQGCCARGPLGPSPSPYLVKAAFVVTLGGGCWDFLPWAVPLRPCLFCPLASLNLSALLHKMGTTALPPLLVSRNTLAALAAGQWPPCPGPQAGLCSRDNPT